MLPTTMMPLKIGWKAMTKNILKVELLILEKQHKHRFMIYRIDVISEAAGYSILILPSYDPNPSKTSLSNWQSTDLIPIAFEEFNSISSEDCKKKKKIAAMLLMQKFYYIKSEKSESLSMLNVRAINTR